MKLMEVVETDPVLAFAVELEDSQSPVGTSQISPSQQ